MPNNKEKIVYFIVDWNKIHVLMSYMFVTETTNQFDSRFESIENTNLVKDHRPSISTKFGLNLIRGFGK